MSDQYWEQTKLLIQADGPNGGSRFSDQRHHVVYRNGSPTFTNAYSRFGGVSMYFSSGSNQIFCPSSTDFDLGSGDFTIEMFARLGASGADVNLIAKWLGGGDSWRILATDLNLSFACNLSAGGTFSVSTAAPVLTLNEWAHIAVVRYGSTVSIYKDGVSVASGNIGGSAITYSNNSSLLIPMGAHVANLYLEEIRLTKGVARYTGAFTPPVNRFSSGIADPSFDKVVFLSHCNGESGSGTPIIDQAGHSVSMTVATTTNELYKFGSSSLKSAGSNSRAESTSADFLLGAGDFTVEFFFHYTGISDWPVFAFEDSAGGGVGLGMHINSGFATDRTFITVNGADVMACSTPVSGSWNHLALVREGSQMRFYINGTLSAIGGTYEIGSTSISQNGRLVIGNKLPLQSVPTMYYEEFRVTKGVARYSANFSAPTDPFPDFSTQKLTGTVLDSAGNPISRTVRSYRSSDGKLIDSATSNPATGAFSLAALDTSEHFVVVHDPAKNALVYDHIVPVI